MAEKTDKTLLNSMQLKDCASVGRALLKRAALKQSVELKKQRDRIGRRFSNDRHPSIEASESLIDTSTRQFKYRRGKMRSYDQTELTNMKNEGKIKISSVLEFPDEPYLNNKIAKSIPFAFDSLIKKKTNPMVKLLTKLILEEKDPLLKQNMHAREFNILTEKHRLLEIPAFLKGKAKEDAEKLKQVSLPIFYGSQKASNDPFVPQLSFEAIETILKNNHFPTPNIDFIDSMPPKDLAKVDDHYKAQKSSVPNISTLPYEGLGQNLKAVGKTCTLRSDFGVLGNWYSSKMRILNKSTSTMKQHCSTWAFTFREFIKLSMAEHGGKGELLMILYLHGVKLLDSQSGFYQNLRELEHLEYRKSLDKISSLEQEIKNMIFEQKKIIESRKVKNIQTDDLALPASKVHTDKSPIKAIIKPPLTHYSQLYTIDPKTGQKSYSPKSQMLEPKLKDPIRQNEPKTAKNKTSPYRIGLKFESKDHLRSVTMNAGFEYSPITHFNFDPLKKQYWGEHGKSESGNPSLVESRSKFGVQGE